MISRLKLWNAAAPVLYISLDGAVTLAGQPRGYWAGQATTNELAPQFEALLRVGPIAYMSGVAGWAAMVVALVLVLPKPWSLAVAIGFTVAHAAAAANWLIYVFDFGGYWVKFVYWPMLAFVLMVLFSLNAPWMADQPRKPGRSGFAGYNSD